MNHSTSREAFVAIERDDTVHITIKWECASAVDVEGICIGRQNERKRNSFADLELASPPRARAHDLTRMKI